MGIQSVTPASAVVPAANPVPAAAAPPLEGAPAAEVDIKPDELGRWSKLHRENREYKAKLDAAEARAAEFDKVKPEAERATKLGGLVGEKKWIEAMEAAGIDPEAAFEAWVQVSQDGAAPPPSKELLDLQAWKAEQEKKAKEAEEASRTTAQSKAARTVDAYLGEQLAKPDAKWALCGREANRAEAVTDARQIIGNMVARWKKENNGADVPSAEAEKFSSAAFDQLEAHYADLGKRYAAATEATSRDTNPRTERVASSIPTITSDRGTLRRPPAEAPKYMTFKEAKAELLAKYRNR